MVGSSNKLATSYQKYTMELVFKPVDGDATENNFSNMTRKVTIVGVGNVGMACLNALASNPQIGAISLVDANAKKLHGVRELFFK